MRLTLSAVTLAFVAATATPLAFAQASAPGSGMTSKSAGSGAALAAADKDFITKAAQGGHAEVEGSKLAAGQAGSEQVKMFAQQMITDHSKAGDELSSLASGKGVTVPTEPSAAQKSTIKSLTSKKGADFDRTYAKTIGVDAHRETVALFKKAAASAQDPDIKAFAQKTLPTLEHHLKMAEDLNKGVAKG